MLFKGDVMQVKKMTALLRNAMGAAQSAAMNANHQKLTAAHLLAALLDDQNMTAKMLLGKAGGDLVGLAASLKSALDSVPQVTGSGAGQLHLDNELARILAAAEAEAKARHDQFAGPPTAVPVPLHLRSGSLLSGRQPDRGRGRDSRARSTTLHVTAVCGDRKAQKSRAPLTAIRE